MGPSGVKDAEDMRQELYTTRIELNSLKQEKKLLLSRIAVVERSHDDMERRYQDQLIATSILRKHRTGGDDSKDLLLDDKIITKLKTALKNAEKQIKQKEQEIDELKHSTKYRSLQKFEEEINRYYLEVVRLKRLLEHQETGTRLLDDDPEKLLSYDDAISELCVKLTKEQDLTKELTGKNDRLSAENDRQKATIETMTSQLFDLNQRHDTLTTDHLKLTEFSKQLGLEHDELKENFENLTKRFNKTTSDLEICSEKLSQTQLELAEKTIVEEKLRVALLDLNDQHQKLAESKQKVERAAAEQKELDLKSIEALDVVIKNTKKDLEHAIERQTKEYATELKEKQEDLDREHAMVVNLRADLTNSQQQNFEIQNTNAKLNYEISAGKDKVAFLEKTIQNDQEASRTLENEISRQKGMCKSLESQLSDRYDKIGVLERKLATLDIQTTEMRSKETSLEQRILGLVNDQLEAQKKISSLQLEATASSQRASILEKAMASTEEKLFDKQNEVIQCYDTINALQVNLQNIEQRNSYLESAVASLDTQLSEKHDHIMQANQIIASLEAQLQTHSQPYPASTGTYGDYRAAYDSFENR
ncbi:UNVERIFIED_CONTAM: hypothetical protein HDU68_007687 [Siphonaria sp. JEL0065]|nr:hypothetical protein HDU68_007687 [Siphonaria sp. JEL0065]